MIEVSNLARSFSFDSAQGHGTLWDARRHSAPFVEFIRLLSSRQRSTENETKKMNNKAVMLPGISRYEKAALPSPVLSKAETGNSKFETRKNSRAIVAASEMLPQESQLDQRSR